MGVPRSARLRQVLGLAGPGDWLCCLHKAGASVRPQRAHGERDAESGRARLRARERCDGCDDMPGGRSGARALERGRARDRHLLRRGLQPGEEAAAWCIGCVRVQPRPSREPRPATERQPAPPRHHLLGSLLHVPCRFHRLLCTRQRQGARRVGRVRLGRAHPPVGRPGSRFGRC